MDSVHYTSNAFTSLQRDVLQFIQNKVFVGRYTEKRYVESLEAYRYNIISFFFFFFFLIFKISFFIQFLYCIGILLLLMQVKK